jgi:F0F1-type ATP synthase membrane subunit b/b'
MGDIIGSLGIQLKPIIIYTILFIIVFIVVNKVLLSRLFDIIEKRQKEIDEGVKLKGSYENKMGEIEIEKAKVNDNVKQEIAKSEKELRSQIFEEQDKIIERAKQEAEDILESAKAQNKLEKAKLEKEFDGRVNKRAIELTLNILKEYNLKPDEKNINKILGEKFTHGRR